MTDYAPNAASQPLAEPDPDPDLTPRRGSGKNATLTGALWGAAFVLVVNAATTMWSNYLCAPKTTSQPLAEPEPDPDLTPRRRSGKNGALTGALWGAAFALVVNAATTMWSNFLTRRDQHVQEADKCNGITASLISTTSFANAASQAAASTLATSVLPNSPTVRFILPPIDELLHSQNQTLDDIDPASSNIIFQLESYYRTIRDDLSHTADVKAEGDTFSLPPNSPNREFYANLLQHIAQKAGAATESLNKSPYCHDLANTSFWSSKPRPRPHVATQ